LLGNTVSPQYRYVGGTNERFIVTNKVVDPSGFFVLGDSYWKAQNAENYAVNFTGNDMNVIARHAGRINSAFVDGHAGAYTPQELQAACESSDMLHSDHGDKGTWTYFDEFGNIKNFF